MAEQNVRIDGPHELQAPKALQRFRNLQTIIELAEVADVRFEQLSAFIEQDESLKHRILRAAGSIGVGHNRPVRSLRHAISLLGLRRVRELVFNTLRADPELTAIYEDGGQTMVEFPHAAPPLT